MRNSKTPARPDTRYEIRDPLPTRSEKGAIGGRATSDNFGRLLLGVLEDVDSRNCQGWQPRGARWGEGRVERTNVRSSTPWGVRRAPVLISLPVRLPGTPIRLNETNPFINFGESGCQAPPIIASSPVPGGWGIQHPASSIVRAGGGFQISNFEFRLDP